MGRRARGRTGGSLRGPGCNETETAGGTFRGGGYMGELHEGGKLTISPLPLSLSLSSSPGCRRAPPRPHRAAPQRQQPHRTAAAASTAEQIAESHGGMQPAHLPAAGRVQEGHGEGGGGGGCRALRMCGYVTNPPHRQINPRSDPDLTPDPRRPPYAPSSRSI